MARAAVGRWRAVGLMAVLAGSAWTGAGCQGTDVVTAGLWFEDVDYESTRLGGALTAGELDAIREVAMAEVRQAFDGLRIDISDRRDARFRIRVVQQLWDWRFASPRGGPAGQSRAFIGGGGQGDVNFLFLASAATSYALSDTSRSAIVTAIGRGIGRTAVHELAHQLLPRRQIDSRDDTGVYEYYSAARREHYYGEMRWGHTRALLEAQYRVR